MFHLLGTSDYVILVNILVIRLFYVFDYKSMLSVRLVNVCGTTLPF